MIAFIDIILFYFRNTRKLSMSEPSKNERKTTNLNREERGRREKRGREERGSRETTFYFKRRSKITFRAIFFVAAKFEHNFLSSLVEMQCNTDIANFVARFSER